MQVHSQSGLLGYAAQFENQRIQLLNLSTDRLRNMYPQHGKDIAVAIGVLPLQGKLCSHASRIDNSQQSRDLSKLSYQLHRGC